jgi:uncharacterized membrane protein YphA (DoxX/SURF4 family)
MWWQDTPMLDVAGRLVIVGFFLFVGVGNLRRSRVENHLNMARAVGVPRPFALFYIGTALNIISSLCVLTGWQAPLGACGLLIFTGLATLIYLPFWKIEDAPRRNAMRNSFLGNICICGGLLLNLQNILMAS